PRDSPWPNRPGCSRLSDADVVTPADDRLSFPDMGERDSSRTRVVPVFDRLKQQDATGRSWLARLIALAEGGTAVSKSTATEPVDLQEGRWGDQEKALAAPRSLLRWVVRHPALQPGCS